MNFPLLRLHLEVASKNIKLMAKKAKDSNVEFRPHFKTHQSRMIGELFKAEGVKAITVSSVEMADFFIDDGWNDITIAFPVDIRKMERLNELSSKAKIHIITDQLESLSILDKRSDHQIGVYLELDPGYGRSGVDYSRRDTISKFIEKVNKAKNLDLSGFYMHAGYTYQCKSKEEIEERILPVLSELKDIKQIYNIPICFGDTPSCSVLDDFGVVDQISPGNFVFYDWMQFKIGSCTKEDIAVSMECPVTAIYPDRNELVIHGGAIHFSKDYIFDESGNKVFGVLYAVNGVKVSGERNYLKALSQEHGILKADKDLISQIRIGDIVSIYPIHSCLTANLMGKYIDDSDNYYDHFSRSYLK